MPKRSDAYMADRRRQILDAALTCMQANGWTRTTIDEVAKTAGLSKGGVYLHFANKRALLVGLLARNVAEFDEIEAQTDIESLCALMLEPVDLIAGDRGARIATAELEMKLEFVRDPALSDQVARAADRLIEALSTAIGRIRPDFDPAETRMRALGIFCLIEGLRAIRSMSDAVSEDDMRRLIRNEFDRLRA